MTYPDELRKLAAMLRKTTEAFTEKTASEAMETRELDPQQVKAFLTFFGRTYEEN